MKHNFKSNRKAFTLIELLIVIAIIGILFVVLVSKVDFATDKAKTTGVQTDFRSFQVAFDTVSQENAGFATLGWDEGDEDGNRERNSYDLGDTNQNGKLDNDETWVGRAQYAEDWTGIYTLDNPADPTDKSAYIALEQAINKNLDPKLHITINAETKEITMKNQALDPWKNEYHGIYLTNAGTDGMDRGAIVMYSDGPNKVFGSEQLIANGIVTITVPGNNIQGQDDYSMISIYTFTNGYGETQTSTGGFSYNQELVNGLGGTRVEYLELEGSNQTYYSKAPAELTFRSTEPLNEFKEVRINNKVLDPQYYTLTEGSTIVTISTDYLETLNPNTYNIKVVSENNTADGSFTIVAQSVNIQGYIYDVPYLLEEAGLRIGIMFDKGGFIYLVQFESFDTYLIETLPYQIIDGIVYVDGLSGIVADDGLSFYVENMGTFRVYDEIVTAEGEYFYPTPFGPASAFVLDTTKTSYKAPATNIRGHYVDFAGTYRNCVNLKSMTMPIGTKYIGLECFQNCTSLKEITIPTSVIQINYSAFDNCTSLSKIVYKGTMEQWSKIDLGSQWAQDIPATEVICSDGIVTIK